MSGDSFKRRKVSADSYQCGCRWERKPVYGDVLIQCPLHQAATEAKVVEFERKIAASAQSSKKEGV